MEPHLKKKLESLGKLILNYKSALVAFSGGIDSTLLLKIAYDILGKNVIAVTVVSELLPAIELSEAKQLTDYLGVHHITITSEEIEDEKFTSNTIERCYYCKCIRYKKILSIAEQKGLNTVLDGTNLDDERDFRPGTRAILELGIKTPLHEVGLNKKEIRSLAREFGLTNWFKPAAACLASRIPYGEKITIEKLSVIEKAEEYLKSLNLGQIRVRHHGITARIEVEPDYFGCVVEESKKIVDFMKSLGYTYITLDLQGFRSGSMNELL